ncbi:MAG: hypothetical protein ABI704_22375 [Kofleriaceae bacterium]
MTMDALKVEERVSRLERLVKVLASLLVVAVALAVFVIVREVRASDPAPAKTPTEFRSGGVLVDENGFDARAKTADGRTAQTLARVSGRNAGFAVGMGKIGISFGAQDEGTTVKIETQGAVESSLEVDTATGTWSIVQRRFDRHRNVLKEQRTSLAPPLPE